MKKLIILVGPMGAGKSTYAFKKLKAVDPKAPKGMVRINQDDLGKKFVMEAFNNAIIAGRDIVVDRINHTKAQRERYLKPAKEHGYKTYIHWIDVPKDICLKRIKERKDHPTINENSPHESILDMYFREFEAPSTDECDELIEVNMDKYAKILDLRNTINGKNYLVVGDIHGCYASFVQLLDKARVEYGFDISNDIIVSVGDLIDRGPNSSLVLGWFFNNYNCYLVEGNHENKLKRWLMGRNVSLANGLLKTTAEIDRDFSNGILDRELLLDWMTNLPHIIRLPDINGRPQYVVHAGVDAKDAIEWQYKENCLYIRYLGGKDFLDSSGKVWHAFLSGEYEIVSGHMIHENPRPNPNVICLDGGAYEGGELRGLINGTELISVKGAY